MAEKKYLKISERITITMAVWLIAFTALAVGISYFHISSIVTSIVESDLEKYVVERGERESEVFRLAKKNQVLLAQRLSERLMEEDPMSELKYKTLFSNERDGAVREKEEIDNYKHPGMFISNFIKPDKALRARAVAFYDFLDHECYLSLATFSDCWVADNEGTLGVFARGPTGYSDQTEPNFNNLEQVWMKAVQPENNPKHLSVWTETYSDPVLKNWEITLATPIYSDGKFQGAIGNDIYIGEVFSRMATAKLDGTVNFIFNSQGFLIAHPTLQNEISAAKGRLRISDLGGRESQLRASFTAFHEQSNKFTKAIPNGLVDVNDESILVVTKLDGPDWYLATLYPKKLIHQAAMNSSRYILISGLLSLFLEIMLLMRLIAARLARPLNNLVSVVERVKAGDLEAKASTHSNDEFGLLGHAFNDMTHNLGLSRLESQKALEEAKRAALVKSEFVASISHEMRTPLNGILGMTEFLTDSDLTDEQRKHANLIYASGNHLLSIINQVLDVSKIEARKFELEEDHFSVRQMLEEVRAIVLYAANEKDLTLVINVSDEAAKLIYGDVARIKQMIINLVGNAIKFSDKGMITITASEVLSTVETATYRFSVRDEGIGIPEDKHGKLFQSFSQTDASMSRQYGGTGLGLYLVKSFAELMNGKVGLVSSEGQGSEFWFEVQMKNHVPLVPKLSQLEADDSFHRINKSKPVLIVDDISINQTVTAALVRKLGFSCIIASNGKSAVELYEPGKFAFILMDCQMPIMDGYEATREIRKKEMGERTLIIALTASTQDRDREACVESGMDDVITKPAKLAMLKSKIQSWLLPAGDQAIEDEIKFAG